MTTLSKKSFFGASLGTLIEYYDYALFSCLYAVLAPIFFPATSVYESLVKGYYLLLIPMFARPLGGLFFGYIGDIFGRRKALLASMYGIAIATTLIGITPSYASIGLTAIIMVISAKVVQLFCFGGEFNGAGIYVVEHAHNKNEGLIGSLLVAMTLFGSLIASLIGIILTYSFMPTWSWRIAFLLGGIIGFLGIIYRKNMLESPHFERANSKAHSLKNLVKQYPKELLASVFMGGFATVPFATVFTFICPILMSKGIFNTHQLMLIESLLTLVAIITLIPAGKLADKYSANKILQLSCWALILLSYPLLIIVDRGNLTTVIFALIAIIVISELFLGPCNAFLKNLFPMQYRYRGSSFGFCIGMSLFGGLTPVIDNALYQYSGQFSGITLWLVFLGLGSLLSIRFAHKSQIQPNILNVTLLNSE